MDGQQEDTDGREEDTELVSFSAFVLTRDQHLMYKAFGKLLPKLQGKVDQYEIPFSKGKKACPEFESHVARIKTTLLPALPRKLCQFCDMLYSPIYFQKLEAPQFQAGMGLLAEVDDILDQTTSLVDSFWIPDEPHELTGVYRRTPRNYRCQRTQLKITDLLRDLEELLHVYCSLIPLSEFRTIMRKPAKAVWGQLIENTHDIGECVDNLIKWFDLSDLGVILDEWQEMAQELEELLEELVEFPTNNPNIRFEPLREFIPIIKLARLFFDKMSKPTNGEPHPIAEMHLSIVLSIQNATLTIPRQIKDYFYSIEYQITPQHLVTPQMASVLVDHFSYALNLLTHELNILGADPSSPPDLYQKSLLWYANWQCQFSLAVRRFRTTYTHIYSDFLVENEV